MALDFPSNPTPGTVYQAPNDVLYVFDGTKWVGSVQVTEISSNLIPADDLAYDLGENVSRWRTVFASTMTLYGTQTSTSTTTGALVIAGGVGVGGSLYVGGPVYSQGIRLTGNEIDPIFTASSAVSITATNITNWNTAYNWGNHATRGYLTSTISSHLIPSANLTYDLGTSSTQWRSLYVGTSTIYIGGNALSVVDGNLSLNGNPAAGSTSTLVNGTATLQLLVNAGQPYVVFPSAYNTQIQLQGNEINALDTATLVLSAGASGIGSVNITTYNPAANSWVFGNDSNLTIPGEIHGATTYGGGGVPNGRAVNITPADDASNKKFKFRVDQYGETFTRAYLDMPTAQNNKQVAITFAHENNTAGYIFNQGADTFDDGLNNAFNIFYNAGDIKLTAMTTGTGVFRTWKFGQSGNFSVPGPIVATTSSGLTLAANYSAQIITDYGDNNRTWTFDGTGGDTTFPNGTIISDDGNGNTQLRVPAVTTGTYKEFTFHNDGRLQLGNTIGYIYTDAPMGKVIIADYLGPNGSPTSPSTVLTLGGSDIFKISSGPPAKNWTFKDNGSVEFPDGTTSTGSTVYVPYATSSSYKIITEIDMLGSYMPQTFEVIGDTIKLPTGNGRIQSGNFLNAWSLDSLNKSFTFPNNSDIEYGEGTYLSTGSLRVRVDFGGEFKIFLSQPNKTWTFDNSGNIVFPDGTTATTAWTKAAASVQSTPPSSPVTGQLYYDTDDGRTYIYTGAAWIDSSPAAGSGVTSITAGTGTAISTSTGAITIWNTGGVGTVLEETFETKNTVTGVTVHDCTTNRLFYLTNVSGNFTPNLTNLNLASGEATSISIVVVQTSTARSISGVQIAGTTTGVVLSWQGSISAPSGNASRTEVFTFSVLCTGSNAYTVLGMMTSFGGV